MLAVTQAETGTERMQLQSEVNLWRSEARYLSQEYRKALADLQRMEGALRQRVQALEAYAAALDDHEQRLARAEWDEPAESANAPQVPVGSHEILKHWRRREDHERVKSQHYATLAYWSLLLQAVAEPRERPEGLAGLKVPSFLHG
jgi:hypothetical protein